MSATSPEPEKTIPWNHRHLGHKTQIVVHGCGCLSVICDDCGITDGKLSVECLANPPEGVHPRLTR